MQSPEEVAKMAQVAFRIVGTEADALRLDNLALADELAATRAELVRLQEEYAWLEDSHRRLRLKLAALQGDLKTVQGWYEDLSKDHSAVVEDNIELRMRLTDLRAARRASTMTARKPVQVCHERGGLLRDVAVKLGLRGE